MTIERAIEILNPEHREHYDSIEPINEACLMGMKALELMRDREPRVIALDEVLGGGECWLEYSNGGCGYADCYLDGCGGVTIYRTMRLDENVPIDNYGKTWRCWTTQPTDKKRKETPWK